MTDQLIERFFKAADALNPDIFMQVLAREPTWQFANEPTLYGGEAVRGAYNSLCEYVVEMRHRIVGHWERADCSTVETRVRYVDRFGRTFEFPGCTLLFFESELAREVRIFVDNHAMFIPPGVSVGNN